MTITGPIAVVLLFVLGLDILVSAASTCIMEMMACTRQMTSDLHAATSIPMMCGAMDVYMSCVECSCNISLTPCDLNNARSTIANLLQDYGLSCELYAPTDGNQCNLSKATTQTTSLWVVCVTLHICYMLNLRIP